ncbi:RING finger protein 207 isoform X4 [Oryctolagus cuniculus]|uniref:RING finger protein 207 isoform X4 n=1 Tax=Oryctolagus cuniculus TaxID=9986 RepID=UPI003879C669
MFESQREGERREERGERENLPSARSRPQIPNGHNSKAGPGNSIRVLVWVAGTPSVASQAIIRELDPEDRRDSVPSPPWWDGAAKGFLCVCPACTTPEGRGRGPRAGRRGAAVSEPALCQQDAETACFCNTCGQPLCARCRDETHRARMFARHDIVALGQRSRDVLQKCPLHAEPYLMFSTDKKSLLCIRCFRDLQGESRAHCVDLESAYVQGCERLEQAVLAVKALQAATREAIALLQAMVEEVRRSAEEEAAAIHALFDSVQEKLAERKALLLQAVQSQYEEKDQAFKEQLSHLATLLPTLQIHLVICSSFLSLANKAEFLDLGYELMERLQRVVTRPHRLRPAQSSKIASDYRAEFARCLEPLLLLGPRRATGAQGGANTTKVLLADGEDSPFAEHCRHYEDSYRGLQAEVQNLKDQVQELHRDLTKHHSLIRAEIMADILHRSLQLDAQIDSEYASVEGMRAVFQEIWEESYQRLAGEQEIYEAQLRDLFQLKQENAHLTTITKHITPYVRSIAKVKERLEPRFQASADDESENPQTAYDASRNGETPASLLLPGSVASAEPPFVN